MSLSRLTLITWIAVFITYAAVFGWAVADKQPKGWHCAASTLPNTGPTCTREAGSWGTRPVASTGGSQ